jgi:hypothetical protein
LASFPARQGRLTQGEIDGVRETFVTKLLDGDDIEVFSATLNPAFPA